MPRATPIPKAIDKFTTSSEETPNRLAAITAEADLVRSPGGKAWSPVEILASPPARLRRRWSHSIYAM